MLNTPDVVNTLTTTGVDVKAASTSIAENVNKTGLDAEALAAIGIDLEEVNRRAENVFGPGALTTTRKSKKHIPFARDAKKAIELALRETIWLNEGEIRERHLMLGILRAECAGRRLIARYVDIADLRTTITPPTSASA